MTGLEKSMIIFFMTLLLIMGYLMISDRETVVSVGRLNQPVPAFALYDLAHEKQYSEDALKNEWTILNIWASWCTPCQLEHPVLMKLSQQGYRIVGVDLKDDVKDAKQFLEKRGNPFTFIVSDIDGKFAFDLGVYGVPETLLIDKDGIVRYRFAGTITEEKFKSSFLPLMQEKQ